MGRAIVVLSVLGAVSALLWQLVGPGFGVPQLDELDPHEHPPIELPAGLPLRATFAGLSNPVRGTAAPPSSGQSIHLSWVRIRGGELRAPWWTSGPPERLYPAAVALPDFSLSKTEVTVAMYRRCVEAGACPADTLTRATLHGEVAEDWSLNCNWRYSDREDQPMNCVDLTEARAFCSWVDGRLPSEAEWVWAAGASRGWLHPWGDEPPDCDHAVMYVPEHTWGCGGDGLQNPCSRAAGASPDGVCDLAGNVWERVEACGPDADQICAHGGSAGYPSPLTMLNAARILDDGTTRADDIGIRCARDG